VVIQSGAGVTVQSGFGVIIASGLFINASGIGVIPASGQGVLVQSGFGVVLVSGLFIASGIWVAGAGGQTSGAVIISGNVAVLSGLVGVTSGEIHIMSGFVTTSITSGSVQVSGIVGVSGSVSIHSGIVNQLTSGRVEIVVGTVRVSGTVSVSGIVGVSGSVSVHSGLVGVLSGEVHVMSGHISVTTPASVLTNATTNPLNCTNASGGQIITSGAILSAIVKALVQNSGDVYIGGVAAGHMPYSGHGLLLAPGEAINLDVGNFGYIHVCAAISGDRVSFIGVV
jgi:hypothetical protein